jgi:HSP20 family molecular chaperone IbpA
VRAAVPGVPLEDLEVMAFGNQLLIKAELRHDHPEHGVTVHVCDFRPGIVFRSIEFPQPIDLKTMELECRDGVLHVRAYKEGAVRADHPKKSPGQKRTKAAVSPRAAKAKA